MNFKIIKELKRTEANKECNVVTCVHYAGGYCVGCENDDECDFAEVTVMQD